MRVIALALALAAGVCVAPASGWAQNASVEELRDQGVLYFKKKLYKQALGTLNKAYAKGGKTDFRTVYYLAQTSYKLLLLENAFARAKDAEKLAGADEKALASTKELLDEMSAFYGGVTFTAAKGETNAKGRIFFEAKTGIINKEKKQRFNAIRERFRSTDVTLPATVYLPYGDYTANKVPFALVQGEEPPTLEIFLQIVVDDTADDSNLWWYVGIGGAVAIAAGVTAVLLLQDPGTEEINRVNWTFPQDPALAGMQ